MAFSIPVLYNGWWVCTDIPMADGTTDVAYRLPNDYMISNAYKIRDGLLNQGYTDLAIAAIIGNMMSESTLSPAGLQKWGVVPGYANSLNDVPNSVMIDYYNHNNPTQRGYGIGLIQWDSYTTNPPVGCTLVSFAMRYNMVWYDGDTQLFRLQREFETDSQFHYWTLNLRVDGRIWTWDDFKNISGVSTDVAEEVWRQGRERGGEDSIPQRKRNTAWWLNYFEDEPDPPEPPDPPGPGPEPHFLPFWLLCNLNRKRGVFKNVRKI